MNISLFDEALVCIGGFCGAVGRYQINDYIPSLPGTLVVNVLGCIAISILMYSSIFFGAFDRKSRLFFGVGVIGSFTTFSAFAYQSFSAGPVIGVLNILANILLGLTGVFIGRVMVTNPRGSAWIT
ncbi:MAG TPA: fluoride efflux transporter CrcB [Methanospirillum sp.]|uniref:fluoride efflux transporter CrcB n=1 Tax=Methanospirillum sp. TaxID=45200 RepID=UPI002C8ABBE5|nr:fluoride efflux transporter CrcB [Methanospirillum sp.]HWQ64248.1 fluoride efflux transporter CrcB [Methanospirillum sp.]